MALEQTNPYVNKSEYTLVKSSEPFEVKSNDATASASYGRSYEYRRSCSAGKRVFAIFLAIFSLGFALIAKAVRDTCAGRKFLKVDVALTEAEVKQFLDAKKEAAFAEKSQAAFAEKFRVFDSKMYLEGELERDDERAKLYNNIASVCIQQGVDFTQADCLEQIEQHRGAIVEGIIPLMQDAGKIVWNILGVFALFKAIVAGEMPQFPDDDESRSHDTDGEIKRVSLDSFPGCALPIDKSELVESEKLDDVWVPSDRLNGWSDR